jgi:Tol biopolymer transport system component
MGEVYRAHDPRLGREVAIKVLPASLTTDPERLRRFEQEARAAAALSHPNILAVYDIGQAALTGGGPPTAFIVMELLPGETLRVKTSGGALPVRKAIDTAVQIANGLAAAHEKGVVHRDLKPENVFVTDAGLVKILDFGLAKLTEVSSPVSGGSVATRQADTHPGVVMGTAGYMSPEQVRGQTVDHRSDIFAFGALLYELLAGARAFRGDTAADLMTAILKEHPPDLPTAERHIPPALARIVDRCLEKAPASRFQSAGDLAFALQSVSAHSGATEAMPAVAGAGPTRRANTGWLAAAGLALALVAAIAYIAFRPAPAQSGPRIATTFPLLLPDGWTISLEQIGGASVAPLAISPDGTQIAILAVGPAGRRRILVRSLDSLAARVLDGTDDATSPFWSPDSQQIAFFAGGKLLKVRAAGGLPFPVCEALVPLGGTWSQAGVILFSVNRPSTPLLRVGEGGGAVTPASKLEPGELHTRPYFLPDGRHFLFRVIPGRSEPRGVIYMGSLDSTERTRLVEVESSNILYSAGHLLYLRQNTLMAHRFDPDRRTLSGDAFSVAEPIQALGTAAVGVFAASPNGVLVYQTGSSQPGSQLTWFDMKGARLNSIGDRATYVDMRLSPDGMRAVVSKRDDSTPDRTADLWVIDVKSGATNRLTFDAGDETAVAWSPDSQHVFYGSSKKGRMDIYRKAADGASSETEIYSDDTNKFPADVSSDGKYLLYGTRQGGPGRAGATQGAPAAAGPGPNQRLWVLPLTGDPKPVPLTADPTENQLLGGFSRNGKWIAYSALESAGPQVYVVPFPAAAGRWQISKTSGVLPRWHGDDRIYFIETGGVLMAARVDGSGGALNVLELTTLGRIGPGAQRNWFAVAPDSTRVLVNSTIAPTTGPRPPLTVVMDWARGK